MSWEITVQTHRGVAEWPWRCRVCEAQHAAWQRQCASCRTFDALKKTNATDEAPPARTVAASPEDEQPPVALRGLPWLNAFLGGGVPARACWLLAGWPGAGKSTLAMQVCAAWPRPAPPLWLSLEQPPGRADSYARRLGARGDMVVYGSDDGPPRTAKGTAALITEHGAKLAVVDSVTKLDPTAIEWLNMWAYKRGVTVVLISQVNSDGEAAGGPGKRHDASMVATLERVGGKDSPRRLLRLDKSQHGDDGGELALVKTPTGALAPE